MTFDLLGGDGDDMLGLAAPAGLDRDGPIQHAIAAGTGTDAPVSALGGWLRGRGLSSLTGPPMQDLVARLNGILQGRYHVERQLGEGGMATVYLAEDLRHR